MAHFDLFLLIGCGSMIRLSLWN